MNNPPATLDSANVLYWAWSGQSPFGVIRAYDGMSEIEIFGLAVAHYETGSVYQFRCDASLDVIGDSDHSSIGKVVDTRKFAIQWVADPKARAADRIRLLNISPNKTHITGPQEKPKAKTKTLAATNASVPRVGARV